MFESSPKLHPFCSSPRTEKPGKHTIEIVDAVPASMKTTSGYGSGERLGQFMDPSNPTKPIAGKQFKFREWQGAGKEAKIEVEVSADTTLTALFDVSEAPLAH